MGCTLLTLLGPDPFPLVHIMGGSCLYFLVLHSGDRAYLVALGDSQKHHRHSTVLELQGGLL